MRRLCAFLFLAQFTRAIINSVYTTAANLDCNFFSDNSFYTDLVLHLPWLKNFLINNPVKYGFIRRTAKNILFPSFFDAASLKAGRP